MAALLLKHFDFCHFIKHPITGNMRQFSFAIRRLLYEEGDHDLSDGKKHVLGKPGSPSALKEQLLPGEEFRTLYIPGHNLDETFERRKFFNDQSEQKLPRQTSMPIDQDWTDTWPTAKAFNWSAVPLPLRQGRVYGSAENDGISPSAYANVELMKIPNFLHLTPAHIKKHTKALKPFCTKWPEGLTKMEENKKGKMKTVDNEELLKKHFPVEVTRRSYVADGLTTRDERARLVTVRIPLSVLKLQGHSLDKLKRLVGDRYDEKTQMITLEADRCPTKVQNYDYLQYLLNALYFESLEKRDWEDEKEPHDEEIYTWEQHPSYKTANHYIDCLDNISNETVKTDEFSKKKDEVIKCVKTATENIFNVGENQETLNDYKQAMKDMLVGLNKTPVSDSPSTSAGS